MKNLGRREFLDWMVAAGFSAFAASVSDAWGVQAMENPLATYPNRDWEKVYRDLWKYDSSFTFLCAPNDTHNCIFNALRPRRRHHAHRPDDGIRRGHRSRRQRVSAIAGIRASARRAWRLRGASTATGGCAIHGARGLQGWVDAGFPREDDGRPPEEYFNRGPRRMGARHARARRRTIVAAALKNIATTYSGEKGQKLLLQHRATMSRSSQATKGAGTQVLKFRGGMPLLGMTRVFGMYRMANSHGAARRKIPQRRSEDRRWAAAAATTTRGTPICRRAIRW